MLFFDRLAMFSPYLIVNQSQPVTILTSSDILHRQDAKNAEGI